MPIFRYLFGVGGALLCLMFLLDAYVPKAPPRDQREVDKSTIRVWARPTGDYVIDHFPSLRSDMAVDPNEAVRRALAMMPEGERKQKRTEVAAATSNKPAAEPVRKRRVGQRTQQTRLANGVAPPPAPAQTGGWSQGWSGNWNNNGWNNTSWSNGGGNRWTNNNRWANNNQWTSW